MLTARWTPLRPHPTQAAYWNSPHRFNVIPAGRRSGKTELAKRKLVRHALRGTGYDDPRYFAAAPVRDQARAIFWSDLKALVPPAFIDGSPRESELCIMLVTGAQIWVVGLDRPERIEGRPWDGGILDEYANMKPDAWGEHVRPALSDRLGWCDLIGVPEGRNHYHDVYRRAVADYAEKGEAAEWRAYQWHSADILPASEIASARADLDELTFRQEYEADWIEFAGRAAYAFTEAEHCARLAYDPRQPLIFAHDFNTSPGVAAVCQEQRLPSGQTGTGVIGEVWIPRNSNTAAVCRRLALDWKDHQGLIYIYGDATGGARKTSALSGSDWDIVLREIDSAFPGRLVWRVPRANPSVRGRLNALNSRLKSGDGRVRMMVDPVRAPHVVLDLEGTRLLEGGSGEIDKRHDPDRSHLLDAVSYYIVYEWPVSPRTTTHTTATGY